MTMKRPTVVFKRHQLIALGIIIFLFGALLLGLHVVPQMFTSPFASTGLYLMVRGLRQHRSQSNGAAEVREDVGGPPEPLPFPRNY